ncbi:SMC-Scp complex subunit ScpB [cyanobacterium TDX16]|nr:SMC-Scp complex subunit ScpB [cyanobacterium TDX16]
MPKDKHKVQLNPPAEEPVEKRTEGDKRAGVAGEAEEVGGEKPRATYHSPLSFPTPDSRPPTSQKLSTQIEAILYLKGKPLSVAEIAEYAQCDRPTAEEGLIELIEDYARRDSALEVVETPTGYSLQLRSGFQDLVHRLIPLELGVGALRTLAAIALHSPIAQNQLVELRGSSAYQHVQELVEQGFVRKRRQSDSRSSLLQLTEKFHQYFQIEQLPQLLGQGHQVKERQSKYQQLELGDDLEDS